MGGVVMDLVNVEFNLEERMGILKIREDPLFLCGCESIREFKKAFIKWISNEFDKSTSQSLGLEFPYVIGDLTFYSLSEIEKYIVGTQNCMKE